MTLEKSIECRICDIASGRYAYGDIDRPWLDTERHMAFMSIGALVEGWSLVVPRAHALNLLDEYKDPAFVSFVRSAISRVESAYGPVVVFEHGGQREGSATSCGTSHAHLHIVPLEFSLQQASAQFDSELQWHPCAVSDVKELTGTQEYLFVADRYEGVYTQGNLCLLREGRSQFFRRVIAHTLGRAHESSYKTHPNLPAAEGGAYTLRLAPSRSRAA